jgi:RimJ/RimL family protein N-acetyltransferase
LETRRLLLRPLSTGDLEDFVALHSDPEVTRYITPFDRRRAEKRLRQNDAEWRDRGHGMLAIIDRERGGFLGRAAIKYWPQFEETEVGWTLRRDAWGHGYATEAARACADWAFSELDVPYLTAMISPGNDRSVAVAERLGMSRLREDVLLGDPVVVYALHEAPCDFGHITGI